MKLFKQTFAAASIWFLAFFSFASVSCGGPGVTSSSGSSRSQESIGDAVYVSTAGQDENEGTKNFPVRNIQKAVKIAKDNGKTLVKVTSGLYIPGAGISVSGVSEFGNAGLYIRQNGLSILGGWNVDFSAQNGITELDGQKSLPVVLLVDSSSNVFLDRFTVRGGNNPYTPLGAGVVISNSGSVILTNFTVSGNRLFDGYGCGILIVNSSGNSVNADVTDNRITNGNSATLGGAGICILNGNGNTISGRVHANFIDNVNGRYPEGAGILIHNGFSNLVLATVDSNGTAYMGYGGGIAIIGGGNNQVRGGVYSNQANIEMHSYSFPSKGGGVFISNSFGNRIDGDVSFNTCMDGYGGGLCLVGLGVNRVTGNVFSNMYYGIWMEGCDLVVPVSNVSGNFMSNFGGSGNLNRIDDVPPVLTITTPSNGQTLTDFMAVYGIAFDDVSGVSQIRLELSDGSTTGIGAFSNWSVAFPVTNGVYTLAVFAKDYSNNVSLTNYVSNVAVTDAAPPSVTCVSPAEGQSTFVQYTALTGTATDINGVTEVRVSLNGGAFSKAVGSNSWTKNVFLSSPTNTIRYFAMDTSSNRSATNTLTLYLKVIVPNPETVFVSLEGSDSNDGYNAPVRTWETALAIAAANGYTNIRVTEGVWTSSDLTASQNFYITNPGIQISGGWDPLFSSRTNRTVVSNGLLTIHLSADYLSLENFEFRSGNGLGLDGYGCVLSNCLFTNNDGGAIGVAGSSNRIFADIVGSRGGPGLQFGGSYNRFTGNVLFCSNTGAGWGGGVYSYYGNSNFFSGAVASNFSKYGGGGVCIMYGNSNRYVGQVTGNTSSTTGGGVYSGGAFYPALYNVFDCDVISNSATSGGGYYFNIACFHQVNGSVIGNSAISGGGIYVVSNSTNLTVNGAVTGNFASAGGGLYVQRAIVMTNWAMVSGNTPTEAWAPSPFALITNATNGQTAPVDWIFRGSVTNCLLPFGGWWVSENGASFRQASTAAGFSSALQLLTNSASTLSYFAMDMFGNTSATNVLTLTATN